jgi:mRNA interferase MazF
MCVLTRNAAIEVLYSVTCAPITRTIRGIRSEVVVGRREGLPVRSVISCDSVVTVPKAWLEEERVGRLGRPKRVELDRALRYALDIQY